MPKAPKRNHSYQCLSHTDPLGVSPLGYPATVSEPELPSHDWEELDQWFSDGDDNDVMYQTNYTSLVKAQNFNNDVVAPLLVVPEGQQQGFCPNQVQHSE